MRAIAQSSGDCPSKDAGATWQWKAVGAAQDYDSKHGRWHALRLLHPVRAAVRCPGLHHVRPMKVILPLSLPATVGIISWILSRAFAFAFPPNSYHPYAHDMQMTFNRIFRVDDLRWTCCGHLRSCRDLQIILHSSQASPVLSAECRVGDIFVVVVVASIWVLACAQDVTAWHRSNQSAGANRRLAMASQRPALML
jgi:hypothetical protein